MISINPLAVLKSPIKIVGVASLPNTTDPLTMFISMGSISRNQSTVAWGVEVDGEGGGSEGLSAVSIFSCALKFRHTARIIAVQLSQLILIVRRLEHLSQPELDQVIVSR